MLRLHGILGRHADPALHERLHRHEQAGSMNTCSSPRPISAGGGWYAGNLHWRARFEPGVLVVIMDGPRDDYLPRRAWAESSSARRLGACVSPEPA